MIEDALRALSLDATLGRNLSAFVALFEKWNRGINLSAASTHEEIVKHVVDSLHVVPFVRDRTRVLDVGSGGGFPVVIAAICLPGVAFTSLEPVHKKHAFLRTAARELGVRNLDPRAERLEDHAVRDYDAAMSRATFELVQWLHTGRTYVHGSGIVLGFEAVPRDDLPTDVERHAYSLGGKPRAIIVARRSA
jgi:16S rRNA (guanine527-N7)-methyltransferase